MWRVRSRCAGWAARGHRRRRLRPHERLVHHRRGAARRRRRPPARLSRRGPAIRGAVRSAGRRAGAGRRTGVRLDLKRGRGQRLGRSNDQEDQDEDRVGAARPDLTRCGVGFVTAQHLARRDARAAAGGRRGRSNGLASPRLAATSGCSRTASPSATDGTRPAPLLAVDGRATRTRTFSRTFRDERNAEIDARRPRHRAAGLAPVRARTAVVTEPRERGRSGARAASSSSRSTSTGRTRPVSGKLGGRPCARRWRRSRTRPRGRHLGALPPLHGRHPRPQLRRVGERAGPRGGAEAAAATASVAHGGRERVRHHPGLPAAGCTRYTPALSLQRGRVAGTACGLRAEAQHLRVVVADLVGELRVDVHAVVLEVAVADRRADQDLVEDLAVALEDVRVTLARAAAT